MTPSILLNLAQAYWETKLFVSILLEALGTPPCCPCLQQSPSCLSKACSVSKSSHKTLALKPFSGDAYPWLLSQAEWDRKPRNMFTGWQREQKNKNQPVPEPCTFWGFQSRNVYYRFLSWRALRFSKMEGLGGCGGGLPRPGSLFQHGCWDGKGRTMNEMPCVAQQNLLGTHKHPNILKGLRN